MPTSLFDTSDLDQWLVKSSSPKKSQDPLAAFKKLSLSKEPEQKLFRLPSILTSDNAGTWLVTRKGNKNDNEKKTVAPLMNDDNDNSKWLAPQPKSEEVKVETDVVTLTEEVNPWLARSSTTTTNLNTLPGKRSNDLIFTLPSQFDSKDSSQWLVKSTPKPKKETPENYEDWLWVPKTEKSTKNLLDPWLEKSSTMSWTSSSSKVEEWLENALEDVTEDFDDCSIEIISQ